MYLVTSVDSYPSIQDDISWGAGEKGVGCPFSPQKKLIKQSQTAQNPKTEAYSPSPTSNWRAGHLNQNDDIKAQICKWTQPVQSGPAVQSISHNPASHFQLLQWLLSHEEPDYGMDQA